MREIKGCLLFNGPVDGYTPVRAYCRAGGASDTFFRMFVGDEMIAFVIDFLWLECQHVTRTGHNAEVTSLATLTVDFYSSYNFCHDF